MWPHAFECGPHAFECGLTHLNVAHAFESGPDAFESGPHAFECGLTHLNVAHAFESGLTTAKNPMHFVVLLIFFMQSCTFSTVPFQCLLN